MPSRKKAKGKARKAAKEAKAKEEESQAVVEATGQRQEEAALEAQLQQLIINAVSPKLCRHGCPSLSADEQKICLDFINAFKAPFHSEDFVDLGQAFLTAYRATKDEYTDVYDPSPSWIQSFQCFCPEGLR